MTVLVNMYTGYDYKYDYDRESDFNLTMAMNKTMADTVRLFFSYSCRTHRPNPRGKLGW